MKPEQAEPRFSAYDGDFVKWFTASETAQIARQFAASIMCSPECDTDEFERWQKLFDEWQK